MMKILMKFAALLMLLAAPVFADTLAPQFILHLNWNTGERMYATVTVSNSATNTVIFKGNTDSTGEIKASFTVPTGAIYMVTIHSALTNTDVAKFPLTMGMISSSTLRSAEAYFVFDKTGGTHALLSAEIRTLIFL